MDRLEEIERDIACYTAKEQEEHPALVTMQYLLSRLEAAEAVVEKTRTFAKHRCPDELAAYDKLKGGDA